MINGTVPAKRLIPLVDRFRGKRILVLGDLMLDHFIRGKVSRISPEAPVPVVQVVSESYMPGGSGNVCNNLAALGATVLSVSIAGSDEASNRLISTLNAGGINTDGILIDPGRPTTQKCRIIAGQQQLVRYDREDTQPVNTKMQQQLAEFVVSHAKDVHAIIISDYGKGVVTPLILSQAIAASRKAGIPITVDPKVEHFRSYKGVDCITPNIHEAWDGMRLLPQEDDKAIYELGRKILSLLQSRSVLITRGESGMTLFERGGRITHIPAQAREVFDVTGAGDTVISVLTLALGCGANLLDSAAIANRAAGIVVGKLGTATVNGDELKDALKDHS
jgi:D-beta-D-heptose 7-phosphate kinase/D-beta-D-heptose 1-phosphate adenosyltransferase